MFIKKNIFILILPLFCIGMKSYSQCCKPDGLYFGGISSELNTFGYYYFKKDSSFFFITTKNAKYPFIKSEQHDTITNIGKGRWYISENYLITKFEKFPVPILYKQKIRYTSKTVQPFDTLFLKLNNTGPVKRTVVFLSGNKSKKIFEYSDNNGNFDLKYPIEYINDTLQLNYTAGKINYIYLQQHNNFHEIDFSLENLNDCSLSVLENFEVPYKIEILINGKKEQLFKDKRFKGIYNGNIFFKKLLEYNAEFDALNSNVYHYILKEILAY